MKITKILSFVAGVSMLAASLLPVKVSAASATLSLSGATNTNGTFSAIVYENSGSARVTTAKIDLGFSSAVSSVSYDYSVGPFSTPTPSGAGATQGYVTGQQAVARVTFKLANPGTVTTSAGGSYLKGTNDEGTQVITHSVSGGAATFTYNAPQPADPGRGGNSPTPVIGGTTPNNGSNNTSSSAAASTSKKVAVNETTSTNGTVAGDATKAEDAPASADKKKDDSKKSEDKKTDDKKASSNGWLWPIALLAVIAGYLAARVVRGRRAAAQAAADAEAAAAAKKAKSTTKPKSKKNKK